MALCDDFWPYFILNVETLQISPYLYYMNMKPILRVLFVLLIICFISVNLTELAAQCPMCRMAAESNLENGGTVGKGLNKGILYMLATPYILVSTVGFIWWKNNKAVKAEEETAEID